MRIYLVLKQIPFLLGLCNYVYCTFSSESLLEHGNYHEENDQKYIKYLSSLEASIKEREQLIRGFVKQHLSDSVSSVMVKSNYLDCKIKELAFNFSKTLQAGTGTLAELKYIFDGLELESSCNHTFPYYSRQKHSNYQSDIQWKSVYVDKLNGRNDDVGNFVHPLKDIQSGIDKCELFLHQSPEQVCTINIRGGRYVITKPLKIRKSNIKIRSYNGENVIVTSDQIIKIDNWNLHDKSLERFKNLNPLFEGIKPKESSKGIQYIGILNSYLDCESRCSTAEICTSYAFFDNTTGDFENQCYIRTDGRWNTVHHTGVASGKRSLIYEADLSSFPNLRKFDQMFINGKRSIRARFPNADPETMGLHTVPTGYVSNAEKWLPPHSSPSAYEIHIESPERPMSLFPKFGIGIDGSVKQFKPPESYWGTKNPFGGGGSTYRVPSGLQYSDDLEINLREWRNPQTGIVHAFQSAHWGNWMYRLDKRDFVNNTLHWTWGGFQEARGNNNGKEWYVENIYEELDVANEWFFDDVSKFLYYSPNLTESDLPKQIAVPQLPSLLVVSGTQKKPVKNVQVHGITFEHSTQTFLEPYMVPSGGDWSVHRNGAIYIEGSENVLVKESTIDSPGGNGIYISDYNRDVTISHNLLHHLGDNGIVVVGDTHLNDGTIGNQPRNINILYNIVFENGIWGKQTYPFVQSRSCQVNVEGNVFFNGPRAGININDGFGGGNSIQNNLLFNFVRETDDHGPINTWDRVPYITRVHDGKTPTLEVKENQIHHNFIINNYRSVWPIDHDDGSCYWNDTFNYLVYGGFKNYLGHNKHSKYNVYVYPDQHPGKGASMTNPHCVDTDGQTLGTSGYGDVYSDNVCIIGRPDLYRLGNCDPQHLFQLIPFMRNNRYYTPKGTIDAVCGSNHWNLTEFQKRGMELETGVSKLVDDDTVIQWGKDLLHI